MYDGSSIIEYINSSVGAVQYDLPGVLETGTSANPHTLYYHSNSLGSTLRTDAATPTTATGTYEYDAYGQTHTIQKSVTTAYLFAGKAGYQTDGTGLTMCGARFYLPIVGRFITQDPSGQSAGLNLYEYCDNNPLSKVDPTGSVAIKLISYRVLLGGWHRGIVVEDNMGHNVAWSFCRRSRKVWLSV